MSNESTFEARAIREAEVYDNEGTSRKTYNSILSHCEAIWMPKVIERFRKELIRDDVNDVLELGSQCWSWVFKAADEMPENLAGINISKGEIERGAELGRELGFVPNFHLMNAHKMSFADESFDAVFGFGILHHLDYETSLDEVYRVLRPGGVMIFNEPLGMNPVGRLVRYLTPKARTVDEQPLLSQHLRMFGERFDIEFIPHQFLSVPAGVISRFTFSSGDNLLMRMAFQADRLLLKIPGLGFWFRTLAIVGRKRVAD
ncbi:MAG: class I SAM-dependent methyltransferase [Planctomycetota bacterium]